MKILYIGDVMAEMGIVAVEKILPELIETNGIDVVIAQAENVSDGKGITVADYNRLKACGVNGFSGGNHTFDKDEISPLLSDPDAPIVAPMNMPDCPEPGYKYVEANGKRVLMVSLLGGIVGKHADIVINNPLQTIDKLLASQVDEPRDGVVINFHGDFSSEKLIIGYYLDGRASVVVGDHWHVPTSDAEVLPKGTAHMSDVGMCGSLDSSLGVTFDSVIPRWRDGYQTRNEIETTGRSQFNALLVDVDEVSGKSSSVEHIRRIW